MMRGVGFVSPPQLALGGGGQSPAVAAPAGEGKTSSRGGSGPASGDKRGGAAAAAAAAAAIKVGPAGGKHLTEAEEATLRHFFEVQLLILAEGLEAPPSVIATALIFFKRFYLKEPILSVDHEPKYIMLTALYVAGKVDEHRAIDMDKIAKRGSKISSEEIVRQELTLLKGLQFHLFVFHAYRPLHGFIEELSAAAAAAEGKDSGGDSSGSSGSGGGGGGAAAVASAALGAEKASPRMRKLEDSGVAFVRRALLSDAPLLYAPGVIALAALHRAAAECDADDVQEFVCQR
eukprot:g5867.t1